MNPATDTIADTVGVYLSTIEPVMSLVNAIRPMAAGIGDDFPYIVYETSGFTQLGGLNHTSRFYEGIIRVHACATEWAAVNAICEAVKEHVPGTTCEGDRYVVTRIKFDDETDVEQAADEHENAYFVRVIDLWVRGRKK